MFKKSYSIIKFFAVRFRIKKIALQIKQKAIARVADSENKRISRRQISPFRKARVPTGTGGGCK